MVNILLVEPDFPIPTKSKNKANKVHPNFVPIGLLKLASYHRSQRHKVKLVRGNQRVGFIPDEIKVTSLFTYWSKYVWDSVKFYREQYPKARIEIGGIYASLLHKTENFQKKLTEFNADVFVGLSEEAESCKPAYDLVDVDYQVIHGMRGCIRRCDFCGTWRIEPKFINKTAEEVVREIEENKKNKVIFYDNNFLANKHAKDILRQIAKIRINGQPIICESQSGFDGRLLDPETANLIKVARFVYPRIAWDHGYDECKEIKKQVDLLVKAGYQRKDVFIFMIYNFDVPFKEMEKKRKMCNSWGVQIVDCRYRPLDQLYDNYNPQAYRIGQTSDDYYIHEKAGWTDENIRQFRKNVRAQNIGVRYGEGNYNHELATTYSNIKRLYKKLGKKPVPKMWQIKRDKKIRKTIEKLKKEARSKGLSF